MADNIGSTHWKRCWKRRWWREVLKGLPALTDEIFDGPLPKRLSDDNIKAVEQFVDNFDLGGKAHDSNIQSFKQIWEATIPVIQRKRR